MGLFGCPCRHTHPDRPTCCRSRPSQGHLESCSKLFRSEFLPWLPGRNVTSPPPETLPTTQALSPLVTVIIVRQKDDLTLVPPKTWGHTTLHTRATSHPTDRKSRLGSSVTVHPRAGHSKEKVQLVRGAQPQKFMSSPRLNTDFCQPIGSNCSSTPHIHPIQHPRNSDTSLVHTFRKNRSPSKGFSKGLDHDASTTFTVFTAAVHFSSRPFTPFSAHTSVVTFAQEMRPTRLFDVVGQLHDPTSSSRDSRTESEQPP